MKSTILTLSNLLWVVGALGGVPNIRARQTHNQLSSTPELRIMPVGDSITHGYQGGPVNADGNGYRLQLWTSLANTNNSTTHIVGSQISGDLPDPYNEGYDGALISEIATYVNASLSAMRPNVVLVHAGTNDMLRNVDPGTAPDRLGTLIDEVVSACPDAAVLVAQIIVEADQDSNARREVYNAAIPGVVDARASAGKKVMVVDMNDLLTTADLIDGIHPVDGGYVKMGEAWVTGIQNASRNGWIEDPVPLSGSSGKGCSSAPTWNPRNQIGSGTGSANIAFADIDGDGKDDYLIFGDGGSVTAYINGGPDVGGNQIWYPQDQIASGIAPSASQVRFGDIWGSSRADYLVVNDDGSVDCWTNAGSNDTAYPGRVTWIQQGQIAASGMGQDGNGVVFADLNGDGRDDYLWVSETGAVTAYLNGAGETGKSSWIPQGTVATGVGANRSEVVFADLNGDGRAEYLWIDTDTGSVKAWLNTASSGGNITWIEWGEVASGVGVGGDDIRFADITGSKRDDYIAIENSNGAIDLWENLCPVASEG